VETDGSTVFTDAFGAIDQSRLAIGQGLTIEAAPVGGTLVARRVHVADPLIGTIEAVSDGMLMVMGVQVDIERQAIAQAVPGQRVAVSGLWQGDRVIASRVTPLANDGPSAIAGAVMGGAIGGVSLVVSASTEAPEEGTFVTAIGQSRTGGFEVSEIIPGRFTGAAGAIAALSVEGYLQPTDNAPFLEVSGLGHSFDASAKLEPFAQSRWLFEGPYSGTFDVDTGSQLPDGLTDRRDFFRGVRAQELTSEKIRAR
ncbi:MAG: DUF5666 domain-containing protein, partial [Pseudomonadota bacterium]